MGEDTIQTSIYRHEDALSLHPRVGLGQSVECGVRNDEAAGSKPAFSINEGAVV